MSNLMNSPFDNYMDYSKLFFDQLFSNLVNGFNMKDYTGTLKFLPLFYKNAPIHVNKMRYTHVFYRSYSTNWPNSRNTLYMSALKVPSRAKPLYLYKDGLLGRRFSDLGYDDDDHDMVIYATDKPHPCDYCVVVVSPHAYVKSLLLLYNEDYSMKEYEHIRVLLWQSGRFYTHKESPFWDLVKNDKHVAFFLDTFSINMEQPACIDAHGYNMSTLDVLKSGEELSELIR